MPYGRMIAAAAAGCAALLAVRAWPHPPAPSAPRVTRVAIRVPCDQLGACALAESYALDVWSEERGADLPLDLVLAAPDLAKLAAGGVRFDILDPDIDATAAAEAARLASPRAATADWFDEYHDYRAIVEHLHGLATLAPDRTAVQAIGNSLENRAIWAIHIGTPAPDHKRMLIDGTQHAREWIAAATATCVADRLVRDYAGDPRIRDFVDHTDLWLVPVVNPDGYQYTWSTDRYWRKNRRDGYGVDLNRNFAVAFGGPGASARKAAENYHGAYAFSEPESAALRDLAKREQSELHVDFHAFGQLLLYPWGYTDKPAPDRARLAAAGDRIASAIYATHEKSYKLMQSVELYAASGTASDWMYGEVGATSFTIELRPGNLWRGRNGFVLPPEEIRPTCDEGLAAVLALRGSR